MTRGNGVSALARCVLALLVICGPLTARAQVGVSITVAPPPLPVYEQPPIPDPGYLWVPGYWSYGPDGYFWVPGTWVLPPEPQLLWTPGYWGWSDGIFVWNQGYWAPQVGFYGGVNYGYGYPGRGYEGGYWRDREFYYNRTVNNVTNVQIQNVYTKTVVNNVTVNSVSYSGGPGGVAARPSAQEQQAGQLRHLPPTSAQTQHRAGAGTRQELLASVNHGAPQIAATAKPSDFSTHVVSASQPGHPSPTTVTGSTDSRVAAADRRPEVANVPQPPKPSPASASPVHARDLPSPPQPAATPGAATAEERQHAQQQSQLQARQNQEREALAQQQERDHANLRPQSGGQTQLQSMERQHQQQTQQLLERHAEEQQRTQRPAPSHAPPAPQHEPPREPPH